MNPNNPWLWQKPRKSVEQSEEVWYEAVSVGHNTLGEMMATISKAAKLSFVYTNQCIRITPISLLETILKDTLPSSLTGGQQQANTGSTQNSLNSVTSSLTATNSILTANNFLSATSPVSSASQKGGHVSTMWPTMVTLPPLLPKTSQASETTTPLNSEQKSSTKTTQFKASNASAMSSSDSNIATTNVLSSSNISNAASTIAKSPQSCQLKQSFTVMPQTNSAANQPLVVMAGDHNKTFALIPVDTGTTKQVLKVTKKKFREGLGKFVHYPLYKIH